MSDIRVDTISAANGTDPVTLTKQMATKAWADWTQVGTQTISDSFNVSSITDVAVGRTIPTITNAMANSNYHVSFSQWDAVVYTTVSVGSSKTTTGFLVVVGDPTPSANDADQVTIGCTGDLA